MTVQRKLSTTHHRIPLLLPPLSLLQPSPCTMTSCTHPTMQKKPVLFSFSCANAVLSRLIISSPQPSVAAWPSSDTPPAFGPAGPWVTLGCLKQPRLCRESYLPFNTTSHSVCLCSRSCNSPMHHDVLHRIPFLVPLFLLLQPTPCTMKFLHSSCSAEGICIVQHFLCKRSAQQIRLDGLLCTAICGCLANFGKTVGLWPQVNPWLPQAAMTVQRRLSRTRHRIPLLLPPFLLMRPAHAP